MKIGVTPERTMSERHNLLILERSNNFSSNLRERVGSKGIATHVVSSLKEAARFVPTLVRPILLVEAEGDDLTSERAVAELTSMEALHNCPLILQTHEQVPNGTEKLLAKHFQAVVAVKHAAPVSDILEGIKYITCSFQYPSNGFIEPKKASAGAPAADETVITEVEDRIPVHEIYGAFQSIPNLFFDQLATTNILSKTFNGCEYTKPFDEHTAYGSSYIPVDSQARTVVKTLSDSLPRWIRAHLHRVTLLSYLIVDALEIDSAIREQTKVAGFMHACSYTGQRDLLRRDYLNRRAKSTRRELCSRIKDSAVKLAVDYEWPAVGKIVSNLGRLVGQEEVVNEQPAMIAASAIMASDIVSRTCWEGDMWKSRSAYRLMRGAKFGTLSEIHPAVLCCVIKTLSEAIASSACLLVLPRRLRNDENLKNEAQRIRDMPITENEVRIAITDLAPGMRLSRPLKAYDGREILDSDLVLDEDLIWRIWQLSLVRPLNAPLIVQTE